MKPVPTGIDSGIEAHNARQQGFQDEIFKEFHRCLPHGRLSLIAGEKGMNTYQWPMLRDNSSTNLKHQLEPRNGLSDQISFKRMEWYFVISDAP